MQGQGPLPSTIWGAALAAANCRAAPRRGRAYPVRWVERSDHLLFVASQAVEVKPLGIRLAPGEVLEVRWDLNQSSYSLAIRKA